MASVAPAPLEPQLDARALGTAGEGCDAGEAWGDAGEGMVQKTSSRLSTPTNGKVLLRGAATLGKAAKIPAVTNSVPMSSYGAAMMLPGLIETESCGDWFHQLGEAYLRLLLNYIVQGFITANIHVMYQNQVQSLDSGPPDCQRLEPTLELICLWLHVISCLTDMCETWDMQELLWYQIPKTAVSSEVFKYVDADGSLVLVSGGYCTLRKVMVTVFILLPKLVIASLVLIWGGMYLAASSSDSDVLLNSLALTFVMGIDEMIFGFLAPARTRHILEALPSFASAVESPIWRFYRYLGTSLRIVISIIAVVMLRYGVKHCGEPGMFEGRN